MTSITIFKGNINNDQWPEVVFAITYVKNIWSIKALENLSLYKTYTHQLFDLSHLQIISSTIYVFLYKEERTLRLWV